jgi:hypothetical protein
MFVPTQGSSKQRQYFDIAYGEDMRQHLRNLVEAHRKGSQDTYSPIDLAYRVQTAMIMGFLALRKRTVLRFDAEKQEIVV